MRDSPGDQSVSTCQRALLAEAMVLADAAVRHLQHAPGVGHIEVAGSIRRRKETVGDLDLLVTCQRAGPVMDRLADYEAVAEVLARGKTKMSVRLRNGMQLDLTVSPEASYGAMLQAYTGSKQHTAQLRRRAGERGLRVTDFGVFRGTKRVAGRTEEELYQAIGLPWIPPELREARGEIDLAVEGRLPKLLELHDLRGDLHLHTTATDGRDSLEEMVHGAKKRGYTYIAITDHSQRVTKARGLDAKRLRQHWKGIDKLASQVKEITLLKGVELDIPEDGRLDLPQDVLAEADWVVASIHFGQSQSREKITRRLLNAIKCPHVHAIGNPTGRLIGKRKGCDVNLDAVFQAAADHGCLLELNAQPDRLDLDVAALMAAKERGVGIVVSTDAHSVEELGHMEFGVYQARRAGLEARDVANTCTLAQFRKLLKR
jgi:DNA polymerase (family 10)